jgi:hypothetical protein
MIGFSLSFFYVVNSRRKPVSPVFVFHLSPRPLHRPEPTTHSPPLLRLFEIRDDALVRGESTCGPALFARAWQWTVSIQSGWTDRQASGVFGCRVRGSEAVFRFDCVCHSPSRQSGQRVPEPTRILIPIRHIYVAPTWKGTQSRNKRREGESV